MSTTGTFPLVRVGVVLALAALMVSVMMRLGATTALAPSWHIAAQPPVRTEAPASEPQSPGVPGDSAVQPKASSAQPVTQPATGAPAAPNTASSGCVLAGASAPSKATVRGGCPAQ